MRLFYGYYGALYSAEELKTEYQRLTDCKESRGDSHEAYPEIQIEHVFRELFTLKGIYPDEALLLSNAQFLRNMSCICWILQSISTVY